LEEGARWLVAGILVGELALEGPLEDGLAEALTLDDLAVAAVVNRIT